MIESYTDKNISCRRHYRIPHPSASVDEDNIIDIARKEVLQEDGLDIYWRKKRNFVKIIKYNLMKIIKSKSQRLCKTYCFVLFLATLSFESIGQKQSPDDLKAFRIEIQQTENGLKMKSTKGSAWLELDFNLIKYKPQAIDEYGMTQLGAESSVKDPKLADYLFTISRTKDGIALIGVEGTAWTKLAFSLSRNGRQSIDEMGMAD